MLFYSSMTKTVNFTLKYLPPVKIRTFWILAGKKEHTKFTFPSQWCVHLGVCFRQTLSNETKLKMVCVQLPLNIIKGVTCFLFPDGCNSEIMVGAGAAFSDNENNMWVELHSRAKIEAALGLKVLSSIITLDMDCTWDVLWEKPVSFEGIDI